MREAVKSARRFVAASEWKDYVLEPFGTFANATTDALLDDYIRSGVGTSAHPVGTASMSAKNATHGVVDPDLRVKRVSGLRVVDASVLVRFYTFLSYANADEMLGSLMSQVGIPKRQCTSLQNGRRT